MLIAILAFVGLLISDSLWGMGVMIVLVGLACSNVFSILFSFALEHRPEQSNEVSALMIMGVSGGAEMVYVTPIRMSGENLPDITDDELVDIYEHLGFHKANFRMEKYMNI